MPKSVWVRVLTLLGGLVLGTLAVFGLPAGSAEAHAALIRTDPVQNAVLSKPPSEIVITFSEAVHPEKNHIFVIDPQGKRIGDGDPRAVGSDLHIPVRTDVPSGTYLVSFRVISADGHPVGGGYSYSVGAPSPGGAPKLINGGATDKVVATGVSAMQFVGFVGLVLVLGPTMVLIAMWPRRLDRRQPIKVAYTGLGLIGASTLIGLYLQAPYGSGASLFDVSGSDISYVMDSQLGRAYLVRLAVVVVLGFLLRPVLAGRGARPDFWLLGILGLVGIATWPLSGHPSTTTVPPLTVVADSAHLISVGIWLGGLVMLAFFLLRRANVRELGAILPVWSNWAMLAISVLVLSGTAQALIEIGTVHALVSTTYGRLIIAKVSLLVVILAFAQRARTIVARHAGFDEIAVESQAEASVEAQAEARAVAYAGHRQAVGGRVDRDHDDDGYEGHDHHDHDRYDHDGYDGRDGDGRGDGGGRDGGGWDGDGGEDLDDVATDGDLEEDVEEDAYLDPEDEAAEEPPRRGL
ncbi:MAG TPA: copper resistance protein CopC, partial [Micromonosporaceae bacterium]|nr:copper resistance protein CopC [Micromonosporaceae bacterium]